MNRRQELCRNFQRGRAVSYFPQSVMVVSQVVGHFGCQYGARCKFLHSTQQQQQPNPYGFGVKNQSQSQSGFGFGASGNQNQQKASDNKERGNRFSPLSGGGTFGSRQNDSQTQVATHVCTDPNICKQQIVEDFKNERPLWKLTSYSHWKYLPCDISGDTSYEELRAAAYDDARRGLPLQQIVERERCLFNSKVSEFENFLHSPYKSPSNSSFVGFNSSSSVFANSTQGGPHGNIPVSASGFHQYGSLGGGGFHSSPGFGPPGDPFGGGSVSRLSASGNQVESSLQGPFGKAPGPSDNFSRVQSLPAQQKFDPTTIGVGTSFPAFGAAGPFSSPGASHSPFGSTSRTNDLNFDTTVSSFGSNSFSSCTTNSMSISGFGNDQRANASMGAKFAGDFSGSPGQNFPNITLPVQGGSISAVDLPKSIQSGQNDIWLKETWAIGEIPEDEPPAYARM